MEDMARLASVEESLRDIDKFRKILYELLRHFNQILDNPYEYQLRTIKSDILKEVAKSDSFSNYLKYVGFEVAGDNFVYPNNFTLSNLRIAQGAIERKINFCFGSIDNDQSTHKAAISIQLALRMNTLGLKVLRTTNKFLLKVQDLFNNMLMYENPELLALARDQIPIVTLQLMALDRVREQQMQLKTGKIKGRDLPFDIALLMELLSWFKHKFFTWVDSPDCEQCGRPTVFTGTSTLTNERESCIVELYSCSGCRGGGASFPRYNHPRTLLRTRRGRCGEFANCFTLLCRSLGYDTRYVYDTMDHVWCEVFDYDSNTWLHADPCEAKLNAPLMYCTGWKKNLSYVLAFSRDDLQDVTWRYTTQHQEVLKRRKNCSERDLIKAIMTLRAARQRHLSEARRLYLARRTAQELVQLMQERKPSDYESHGRISGSTVWRQMRGEGELEGYTFQLLHPGNHGIRYISSADKYRINSSEQLKLISGWEACVFSSKNMVRTIERDWRKVYLGRAEGESTGSITWKLSCGPGLRGSFIIMRAVTTVFENGHVQWTVGFDSEPPYVVELGDKPKQFRQKFYTVTITAELSGGVGDVAWQHAQLFRDSLGNLSAGFEINAYLDKEPRSM